MGETFSIHLDKVTDAVLAAIPAASFKAMEHLREVAVNRTPIESGDLRTSADRKGRSRTAATHSCCERQRQC